METRSNQVLVGTVVLSLLVGLLFFTVWIVGLNTETRKCYDIYFSQGVGGLNREADGSEWDGSTNPTESSTGATSELLSNRQSTPTTTPTGTPTKNKDGRGGAIRKVYSVADRNAAREAERNRAEARRLREQSRTSRRDFSYQRSAVGTESTVTESLLDNGTDLGTKSYHHPMPELRAQRQRDREERRARRGGYRRGRGDDEDGL